MPQGPSPNNKSTVTAGVVFSNPGNSPVNPLAGVTATATKTGTTVSVQGQVPGTSVLVSNPA
jgi:hypothetical protein